MLQAGPWYQRLTFQPAELAVMCQPLVRQALAALQAFLQGPGASAPGLSLAGQGNVGAIILTQAAAHLPGLAAALTSAQEQPAPAPPAPAPDEDFGEGLLQDETSGCGQVYVLGPDAVARAAHELAMRVHRGDLPAGPVEAVPLPVAPRSHDTGLPSLRLRLPPRGTTRMEPTAPRWRIQPDED